MMRRLGLEVVRRFSVIVGFLVITGGTAFAAPPAADVPEAVAATAEDMQPYAEVIDDTDVTIEMVPIPAGEFLMGSPESENERGEDEGPARLNGNVVRKIKPGEALTRVIESIIVRQ